MESQTSPVRRWGKDIDRGVVGVSSDTPTVPPGPTCGCAGCTKRATAVIQHPAYGRRTVCDDHVRDFTVIDNV